MSGHMQAHDQIYGLYKHQQDACVCPGGNDLRHISPDMQTRQHLQGLQRLMNVTVTLRHSGVW